MLHVSNLDGVGRLMTYLSREAWNLIAQNRPQIGMNNQSVVTRVSIEQYWVSGPKNGTKSKKLQPIPIPVGTGSIIFGTGPGIGWDRVQNRLAGF